MEYRSPIDKITWRLLVILGVFLPSMCIARKNLGYSDWKKWSKIFSINLKELEKNYAGEITKYTALKLLEFEEDESSGLDKGSFRPSIKSQVEINKIKTSASINSVGKMKSLSSNTIKSVGKIKSTNSRVVTKTKTIELV